MRPTCISGGKPSQFYRSSTLQIRMLVRALACSWMCTRSSGRAQMALRGAVGVVVTGVVFQRPHQSPSTTQVASSASKQKSGRSSRTGSSPNTAGRSITVYRLKGSRAAANAFAAAPCMPPSRLSNLSRLFKSCAHLTEAFHSYQSCRTLELGAGQFVCTEVPTVVRFNSPALGSAKERREFTLPDLASAVAPAKTVASKSYPCLDGVGGCSGSRWPGQGRLYLATCFP